jgi:hypothetical protein
VIKAASLLVVEDRRRHAEHVMRDRHHGGREVDGLNVAILVADGFEEVELTGPRKALDQAVPIQMWSRPRRSRRAGTSRTGAATLRSTCPLEEADPDDFDALLLPGVSSILTHCGSRPRQSPSSKRSSTKSSRWQRFARKEAASKPYSTYLRSFLTISRRSSATLQLPSALPLGGIRRAPARALEGAASSMIIYVVLRIALGFC